MSRFGLALVCLSASASAQTTIKARAMVMVDTSGSMVWHFGDCDSTGGDGANPSLFCDNHIGGSYDCSKACSVANGGVNEFPVANPNNPSRLFAAKAALTDA